MKLRRKLTIVWICGLIALMFPLCAPAQVVSTGEPTGGKAIYVAGNPDLYPLEYYDESTESYEGVLPDLYRQISQEQGMDICFVSAGEDNQQQRLAKNNQVELVSAHYRGEIRNLANEYTLLSYTQDGKEYEVCIGFTDIASQDLVQLLERELDRVGDGTLLSATLARTAGKRDEGITLGCLLAMIGLSAACVVLLMRMFCSHRKKRKQEENSHIDPLTGIGNKKYFRYSFEHMISPETSSLYYIAYLAADEEQMKKYYSGNKIEEIQKYGADVISSGAGDTDFAARISDGVFALAFQCISRDQAQVRVKELLNRLNDYDLEQEEDYHVPFRAGIYGLTGTALSCETALNNARQGYRYALRNKLELCCSDREFLGKEAAKDRLAGKILEGIRSRQFVMYLQFIVEPKSGRISGAEALSRWMNPEEGLMTPGRYVETMINAGITERLDFYILEEVCKTLEQWSGTRYQDLYISCNFARPTVSSDDFFARFREITGKYSFNHHNLVLEMTEDALAENQSLVFQNMLACKELGYRIALDDLGSGYTSFRDLSDYPLDIIKIDRHLVKKAVTEKGNALLVGIIRLARDLGIGVLCEGVETEEENEIICRSGCDYIQGYYYSRVFPMEYAMDYYERYMNKK